MNEMGRRFRRVESYILTVSSAGWIKLGLVGMPKVIQVIGVGMDTTKFVLKCKKLNV